MDFIELKTTENQTLFVKPETITAFEVVTASNRVEGHIKLYINGFKFLVAIDAKDLMAKLAVAPRHG